jgi:hypothetical protein
MASRAPLTWVRLVRRGAILALAGSCSHGTPDAQPTQTPPPPPFSPVDASEPADAQPDGDRPPIDAPADRVPTVVDGPHRRSLEEGRPIYYAFPDRPPDTELPDLPWRLVAALHGTCGGPDYACASWIHAGVEVGALVCPTGNAHCGPSPLSPPTWEAPSWGELVADMDADLERSVSIVSRHSPHPIGREGAILTGYSRGGYAVPFIAGRRPGRWPLLLIIEADATLDPVSLRRARVRAVALVAGEWGDQLAGMKKSADALAAASFPARLFLMPKTGHLLSSNIEEVMREALGFLVATDSDSGAP